MPDTAFQHHNTLRLLYHGNLHQAYVNLPKLYSAVKYYRQESPAPVLQVNPTLGTHLSKHWAWLMPVFRQMGIQTAMPPAALPAETDPKHGLTVTHKVENGVGFIKAHWANAPSLTPQKNVFDDLAKQVQHTVDRLSPVNKVVLLTNMDDSMASQLAQSVSGVDVIVNGNSQTQIKGVIDGINWLKSKSGEPVLIVQPGDYGQYLGVADLAFNEAGHLTYVGNRLIPTKHFPPDAQVQQALETKLGKNKAVGWFKHTIAKADRTFGTWLAVQMRMATDADIALIDKTAWQADLPAGLIGQWHLNAAFPEENTPYVSVQLPVKVWLDKLSADSVDTNHWMVSPVVLKRDLTGKPIAIWSEYKRLWLTENDLITITLNKSALDKATSKNQADLPFVDAVVLKQHALSLGKLIANSMQRSATFQYTA